LCQNYFLVISGSITPLEPSNFKLLKYDGRVVYAFANGFCSFSRFSIFAVELKQKVNKFAKRSFGGSWVSMCDIVYYSAIIV